jgi:predicted O-methyltransferase YrrM
MIDDAPRHVPVLVTELTGLAARNGFPMSCEVRTGALLRVLAASKPGGRFLELGTGYGVGAAWMLAGMDSDATLTTVEADGDTYAAVMGILTDSRLTRVSASAGDYLSVLGDDEHFDMAFVDCRPGKFERLDELLAHLRPGGIYVVDDLLPQPTWPEDHPERVEGFLKRWPFLDGEFRAQIVMDWASGLAIGVKS